MEGICFESCVLLLNSDTNFRHLIIYKAPDASSSLPIPARGCASCLQSAPDFMAACYRCELRRRTLLAQVSRISSVTASAQRENLICKIYVINSSKKKYFKCTVKVTIYFHESVLTIKEHKSAWIASSTSLPGCIDFLFCCVILCVTGTV